VYGRIQFVLWEAEVDRRGAGARGAPRVGGVYGRIQFVLWEAEVDRREAGARGAPRVGAVYGRIQFGRTRGRDLPAPC
jgi:hypothetical protein